MKNVTLVTELKCVIFFLLTLFLIMFGCGGGFKGDSKGASDLGGAIFGPDSIK